jgi:hypothetical protein
MSKSPVRFSKTPGKNLNISYSTKMSMSKFGFRSQYGGGAPLRNSLSVKNKSTFGFYKNDDRFENKYIMKKDRNAQSSIDFTKKNAAKYNNFIRHSPGTKSLKHGLSTSSSRYHGGYNSSGMKHVKSTLTMRTEYLPMGSALSKQLTEAKLIKGSKKRKEKEEAPSEELYKFPTLG